jgi:hypothetical protein
MLYAGVTVMREYKGSEIRNIAVVDTGERQDQFGRCARLRVRKLEAARIGERTAPP